MITAKFPLGSLVQTRGVASLRITNPALTAMSANPCPAISWATGEKSTPMIRQ